MSTPKEELELEKLRVEIQKEHVELLKALNDLENWNLDRGHSMVNRRIVRLTAGIDDESVGQVRSELYDLSRLYPNQSLILDINSPGGSYHDGLELFGVLRELSNEGHQIITRIGGKAASMGGVIAQAGDVRQIRRHSWLHIHEAAAGAWGKASEMKESAEYVERITRDMAKIYAERSMMTAEQIYNRIEHREWWIDCDEALTLGFVDEII